MRSEFEKNRYWIGLYRSDVDFDETIGEFGRYVANGSRSFDAIDLEAFNEKWEAYANAWQHQQSKVDELQHRNQMLNDNIKEQGQKLVYQNEVIETQAEKLLGLRDEKAELQKRVDAAHDALTELKEKSEALHHRWQIFSDSVALAEAEMIDMCVKELEQALKGGG